MVNAGTILAYLDLDTSKFSNALGAAQGQLTSFASEGSGLSGMLDGIGQAATTVGQAMTLGITTPLVGLAASAVSTGMTFDASMSNVMALSGATANEFQDLREKAMEMGAATKFSATNAADAFGYMALAGWDAEQMIGGIPGVLDLAAAANMDLAKASDIVTDTMTPFKMAAEEAGRAADVFAYAQANSNTNVLQLGDAMKYVAPNAAAFSMTLEDTAGALGILANAGIKGSMAGTTLNAILRDMKKNAEDGAIAIGDASVSIVNADGSYRAYADIIRDIETATQGMTESQRDAALAAVFGDESIKGVNATLAQGSDALQAFTDDLYHSEDAASKMAAIMEDNLQGDITTLKSGIEGMAISLSDFLTPTLRTVTQAITSAVQWFNGLDTGIKNTVFRIGAIAAAAGPVLLVGGKLLSMVSGFAGPLGLVASGIALVYSHSERLQGIVSTIGETASGLFSSIKAGFAGYNESMKTGANRTTAIQVALSRAFGVKNAQAIQNVTSKMQAGFKKATTIVSGTANVVGSFLGALIDGRPVIDAVENSLSVAFGSETANKITSVAASVRNTFAPALSVVRDYASQAGETLRAMWEKLPGMVDAAKAALLDAKGYFVDLAGDIQTAWSEDGILGVFGVLGDRIGDALRSAGAAAMEGAQNIREKIGEGLELAKEWLQPKVSGWMSNLGDAYQSAQSYVTSKLPAVREAIASGLQVAKETLTSKAQQAMTWLGNAYRSDTVQGFLGDLSGVASSIFDKIAAAKETITTKAGELVNALGAAMGSDAVKEKIADLSGVVANIAEKVTSGTGAWQTTAATLISDLVTQMTTTKLTETVLTGLGTVAQGIIDGLSTAQANFAEAATTILSNLTGAFLNEGLITSAFTTAGSVLEAIMNAIAGATVATTAAAEAIIGKVFTAISEVNWEKVSTTAQTVMTGILNALGTAVPKVTTAATSLVSSIISGIAGVPWDTMGTELGNVATNLIDGILNNLPATVEGAGQLVAKIGEGIASAGEALATAAEGFVSSLVGWILTPSNWMKLLTVGGSLVGGIAQGVLTLGANAMGGAVEFLVGIVKGISNRVLEAFGLDVSTEIAYTVEDFLFTVQDMGITSIDQLNLALEQRASLLAQGISDGIAETEWMANDAVVALFRTMIDETATSADRAAAMAALHMAGFAPAIGQAMQTGGPEVRQQAADLMDQGVDAVDQALSGMGVKLVGSISSGVEGALPTLETAAQQVADTASIVDEKANVEANATEVGEGAVDALKTAEEGGVEGVTTATQGLSDAVTNTIDPLPGLMEELSKNGVTGMATAVTANESSVTTAVQTLSDNAVNTALATMSVETGQKIGSEFVGGIISGGQNQASSLLGAYRNAAQSAVNAARNAMSVSTGHSIGQAMIQAIANGATSAGSALTSAMTSLAQSAVSAFKEAIEMHSPPRAFTEIGELIPVAVGIGTDSNQSEATKSIVRLAKSIQDAWIPPDFDDGWPTGPTWQGGGRGSGSGYYSGEPVAIHFHGDFIVRNDEDIDNVTQGIGSEVSDIIRGGGG